VCTFSFFPTRFARANVLFDAIAGLFPEQNTEGKNFSVTIEKNSQNMPIAEAARNLKVNQEDEETDPLIADMEGSALSAVRSASLAGGNDNKPILNSGDQISVYVVREGDTLSQVAKMFGVSSNTVRFANDIPKGGSLRVGQQLVILPVSGIQYVVKKGDTINKIAKKYSGDAQEIKDFNGIDDSSLQIGDTIIIPNGVEVSVPIVTSVKKFIANIMTADSGIQTDGYFIRPAKGGKTQGIHGHNGIDFSARGGLSVVAAASGKVLISLSSGYNGGYGRYVVIAHSNGTQTLYAHLSANFVSAGDTVEQGQLIGNIGNTGLSTGPHLHFEVRGAKNPF
jgi:murein DD-endopeptidase MepM/ murein hydrolase activator NlpD